MYAWQNNILFGTSPLLVSNPEPEFGEEIKISFLLPKNHTVAEATLSAINNSYCTHIKMEQREYNESFVEFYAKLKILNKVTNYFFILKDKSGYTYFLTNEGLTPYMPSYYLQFFLIRDPQYPSWLKEAIFYQIFPDRFSDGMPDPPDYDFEYNGFRRVKQDWNAPPLPWHKARTYDHNGGDFQGIINKINYLKDLGINAIYLNPIFLSPVNHKYHTEDFFQTDPGFGTKELFAKLVDLLHRNNIRIIIDGVFNHVGWYHKWFNKFKKYTDDPGAYNSPDSKYFDFFIFEKYPDKYLAWANVPDLPVLNYMNPELKRIIYQDENSVIQYWLREFNIDGWRFDVASNVGNYPQIGIEIGDQILSQMRQAIKKYGKDKLMMGEVFYDSVKYLRAGIFDTAMNYNGFMNPVLSYVGDKRFYIIEANWQENVRQISNKAAIFSQELAQFRKYLNFPILAQMYNLLDSHDTPRVASILSDKSKQILAMVLQFTYIGVPAIYYGDEIGARGYKEPDNRRTFDWNEQNWDKHLLRTYKTLIKLRKDYKHILTQGLYKELYAHGDVFAFVRITRLGQILVVLNAGETDAELTLDLSPFGMRAQEFGELFSHNGAVFRSGEDSFLKFGLAANSAIVLLRDKRF